MPVWLIVAEVWGLWTIVSLIALALHDYRRNPSRFVVLCAWSFAPYYLIVEGISRGYNWLFASR